MGAIHNLLARMGYVKLDRYGLLLTPEGRILSSRPAVLDDGLGGRIVGWEDGDLAAMELEKWEPARPTRKANRLVVKHPAPALPHAATVPQPAAPAPLPATASAVAVATAPTIPAPARPPVPVAAKPVVVAPPVEAEAEEPQDDEDWEWTIAVARARAAAEEAEQAAAAPKFVTPVAAKPAPVAATPAPKFVAPATAVPKFMPTVRTQPMATIAPKRANATTPPPLPTVDEDTQVKAPIVETPAAEVTQVRAPILPKTVIAVPQLPRATDTALVRPAVIARGSGSQVTPPLRRVPRGTDRIEDTVRTAAAPANDDKTSPGVALPPSGGGRRVAAKQR